MENSSVRKSHEENRLVTVLYGFILPVNAGKQLIERRFLEERQTQNL
jgi:hypothetical protein